MDLRQRVVRRNPFVAWVLNGLAVVSVLLFVHTMVWQNLSEPDRRPWPWSWQLLDAQSATAALLAAVGAIVARAQFARTVRPMLSSAGWVTADHAPGGALSWVGFLCNGGSAAVVVTAVEYRLDFAADPADPADAADAASAAEPGTAHSTGWTTLDAVKAAAAARGLRSGTDYRFTSVTPNAVLAGEQRSVLVWFAEPALAVVRHAYVRVTVRDRLGDIHQRIVPCLVDADRVLRHAGPDLL
ncbi:hypothetical protein [Kitasatospora sp. NPDC004272]